MFPSDDEVQEEHEGEEGSRFFVRITDLPLQDKLRELRCASGPPATLPTTALGPG